MTRASVQTHDILVRLEDLHKQATEERSHYYVGRCVRDAMDEIEGLRRAIVLLSQENLRLSGNRT